MWRSLVTADVTQSRPVADPSSLLEGHFEADSTVTTAIPTTPYYPIAEPPATTGMLAASRRIKRLTETREIRVRTTHRRRKVFARGGVLAGFGLAMVVYPVMGNVVEYHNSAEDVPGVVIGETPTTGYALLGEGPSLIPTVLDLPEVDDQAQALAATTDHYTLSQLLPNCLPPAVYQGENGKLGTDQLCTLPWGTNITMRADAALALAELNEQFKATFGRDICMYQGYRTLDEQYAARSSRGYLAASPGTSMHGMGLAFDLCRGDDSGDPKRWFDANAGAYGFENPGWAQTRKFEPWHWEYKPGTDALGVYGDSGSWGKSTDGAADGTADTVVVPGAVVPAAPTDPTPAPSPTPAPAP